MIRTSKRAGFTLVELMVAMALTLFIMTILSQAFVTSLATFSQLKGIGDMQLNLRTVAGLLQNDLELNHFGRQERLSDPTFLTKRPSEGFFVVVQGTPSQLEAQEPITSTTAIPSFRAVNHMLYFTVKNRGNLPENYFSATVPVGSPLLLPSANVLGIPTAFQTGNAFRSQWAEVAYFLVPTGTTDDLSTPGGTGTPLFALYRSMHLLVPDPTAINAAAIPANTANFNAYAAVSCIPSGGQLLFNSPSTVASATPTYLRPLSLTSAPPTRNGQPAGQLPVGAAVVLSNVVSFQVQVLKTNIATFEDVASFDSSAPAFGIQALRIQIRIWDPKTTQSRQITVLESL